MKTTKLINVLILAIALVISFSACKKATQDFVEEKVPADNASITGTLAGKINHDELDMSDKASCTFDRFPWTVAKFQELQAQVSTEPQGAVTMVLIAMEIYRKYPVIGEKCLYLATTENEHDPNNPGRMSKDRIMHRLSELRRRILFHALEEAGYPHSEAQVLAEQREQARPVALGLLLEQCG